METWIVECPICRQPFELDAVLAPVAVPEPPEEFLTIPATVTRLTAHAAKGKPATQCMGEGRQGIGMGRKSEYEGDGTPLLRLN
jgi:hypothetical protein